MKMFPLACAILAAGLTIGLSAKASEPAPATPYVQISVTDVEAQNGQTLPVWTAKPVQGQVRDDLAALKDAAAHSGIALSVTPRFTVTTFDGVAASASEQTQIPYVASPSPMDAAGKAVNYATVRSEFTATPHINKGGVFTIDFTLTESRADRVPWRELGPPRNVSISVTSERGLVEGETVFLPYSPEHYAFLTLHVLPAKP